MATDATATTTATAAMGWSEEARAYVAAYMETAGQAAYVADYLGADWTPEALLALLRGLCEWQAEYRQRFAAEGGYWTSPDVARSDASAGYLDWQGNHRYAIELVLARLGDQAAAA